MMSNIRAVSIMSCGRRRAASSTALTAVTAFLAFGTLAGCASSHGVRLESLGPSFPATIWESIEVIPSVGGVQRSFIPLAHLRVPVLEGFLDNETIEALQREASRVGANAIVLADLGSEDPWEEPRESGAWEGVATAIRVLEGRWADRYWSYGPSPQPLQNPDVDALSPNRYPRQGDGAAGARTTAQGDRVSSTPPVEPAAYTWHRVVTWTGTGTEKTDAFTVPSGEWRVSWEAVTGGTKNLEILVYDLADDALTARIDQDGIGTGSYLGLAGGGTYYLQINGEGVSWEIAIDAWAPAP